MVVHIADIPAAGFIHSKHTQTYINETDEIRLLTTHIRMLMRREVGQNRDLTHESCMGAGEPQTSLPERDTRSTQRYCAVAGGLQF